MSSRSSSSHLRHRALAAALVAALVVAGCGGDHAGSVDEDSTSASVDDTIGIAGDDTADDGRGEFDDAMAGGGDEAVDADDAFAASGEEVPSAEPSFELGDIGFRVVNTLDEPVDLYVRTTGLVEAFVVEEALAPGAVSDFHRPPTEGTFLVTEAGAGDATCVSECDQFIAQLATFPEEGPVRTVVLYADDAGEPAAVELWEQPDPSREGSANAMVPADPDAGLVVVTAIALADAEFGLQLALDGIAGCQTSTNLASNVLVGGNQTPAYAYGGDSVDVVLHDHQDRECQGAPLGGPFSIEGGPGTRTHLILAGSPGAIEGIVVPMVEGSDGETSSGPPTPDPSDGDGGAAAGGDGGDRALAVELIAAEVEASLGFPLDQAECTAELLVDAIGVDVLLDGDQLVDLDSLPPDFDVPAAEALTDSIAVCGVDPGAFGG